MSIRETSFRESGRSNTDWTSPFGDKPRTDWRGNDETDASKSAGTSTSKSGDATKTSGDSATPATGDATQATAHAKPENTSGGYIFERLGALMGQVKNAKELFSASVGHNATQKPSGAAAATTQAQVNAKSNAASRSPTSSTGTNVNQLASVMGKTSSPSFSASSGSSASTTTPSTTGTPETASYYSG